MLVYPNVFGLMRFAQLPFVINCLPSAVIQHKSPYFRLFKRDADYLFLRVFGTAFYPHLRPYNAHKLDYRSHICTFIGYSTNHKGYLCFHRPSSRVYVSRNILFDETVFPFRDSLSSPSTILSSSSHPSLPLSLILPSPPPRTESPLQPPTFSSPRAPYGSSSCTLWVLFFTSK